MEWRKITAIIRGDKLEAVEQRLTKLGVRGISITRGKGYGEYANFFSRDWSVTHARIEVFNTASRAEEIAQAIMEASHTGSAGDGIVAILPVERIYRIRSKAEVRSGEI
jgi:nitrogen regulatory protein P-II 1